jgi:hypothetical protein
MENLTERGQGGRRVRGERRSGVDTPASKVRLWQDERRVNPDRRSGSDRRKPTSPRKSIKWYHVALAAMALCWADLKYWDGEHSGQVLQKAAYELNARLAEWVGVAFVRR